MARLMLALLLLNCFSCIRGQCSADTCTKQCIPNQWERDLCLFYQEIAAWRNSAIRCELNVYPIPQRVSSSSPADQWEQARQYWEHLRSVWQQAANENGVFGFQDVPSPTPAVVVSTTPQTTTQVDSERLTPFPMEMDMEELGSGFIGSASGSGMPIEPTTDMPTDPPTEDPSATTAPPPTINPPTPTQRDMWLSGVCSWESDFAQWESFTRTESGLRLPGSESGDIVGRIVTESGSSGERANSATWLNLVRDWNEGFVVYNSTFSGSCPDQ